VRYLAEQEGIQQFLDIGTGLPTASNTDEVAQAAAPAARVVYVDNDPMVLTHARALLTSTPQGATSYLDADLREPDAILAGAAELLDFSQPVAVLLIGILQLIPDADGPAAIVARLVEAVPRGSWLAVYHPASDIDQDRVGEAVRRVNARSAGTTTLRSYDQVARFFDGLRLIEPGLVRVQRWRPGAAAADDGEEIAAYAGLARKR
jgi:S-adenosyl methyltransferase